MTGVIGRTVSGRQVLGVLGVWLLLSAAAGAVTVVAARDTAWLTPLVVAEVYASVVVAAALVLGRRLRPAVDLNRAPAHAFALSSVALAGAYGVTAGVHTLLTPLLGAWSEVVGAPARDWFG